MRFLGVRQNLLFSGLFVLTLSLLLPYPLSAESVNPPVRVAVRLAPARPPAARAPQGSEVNLDTFTLTQIGEHYQPTMKSD